MKKNIDLRNDPINKLFYHYLFSSVTGMLVKSVHIVLDGIFVGNGVGAEALAAVNIIMPVFSLFMALAMMIGVGGSTLVSMKFGENEPQKAKNIFLQSIIIIFTIGVLAQIFFLIDPESICRFLGANDVIIGYTVEYGKYITYFMPLFALSIGLNVFVRNDSDPKTSMYSMITSAIVNATLNYIFIFPMRMGLKGAAIATGISQIVSCLILISHFTRNKGGLRLEFRSVNFHSSELIKLVKIGFPSFLGEISFGVVSLVFNRVIMSIAGELAVSAFSIMMYVTTIMYMVFFGISQAIQPIISFNYGANKYDRLYKSYHLGIKVGFISGICFTIVGLIFIDKIVMLFNRTNKELIEMAITANKYLFYTFALASYNICMATFFQATGNAKISSLLTFLRNFVVNIALIFILTSKFGILGVWLVYPCSEIFSVLIGMYLMKYKQNIIDKVF